MPQVDPRTLRYREDEVYRRRRINEALSYNDRHKNNKTYLQLKVARKKIWNLRDSIERLLNRVKKRESQLIYYIKKRDQLAVAWKIERAKKQKIKKYSTREHDFRD